jgi:twitching motility protein PilT
MDIQHFFSEAVRLQASDIHLIVGYLPMIRVAGKLQPIDGTTILSAEDVQNLVFQTFTDAQKDQFLTNKEIDFSIASQGGRFRSNIYYQRGTIAADFRLIPNNESLDFLRSAMNSVNCVRVLYW